MSKSPVLFPLSNATHESAYTFFVYKKVRLKWSKSEENLKKVTRFNFQNLVFRRYCMQNVNDGIQIRVCNINNECFTHCSQFISVKAKKNLRKSQAQFREKLRKLRLRQNDTFLLKKDM